MKFDKKAKTLAFYRIFGSSLLVSSNSKNQKIHFESSPTERRLSIINLMAFEILNSSKKSILVLKEYQDYRATIKDHEVSVSASSPSIELLIGPLIKDIKQVVSKKSRDW